MLMMSSFGSMIIITMRKNLRRRSVKHLSSARIALESPLLHVHLRTHDPGASCGEREINKKRI